MSRDLDPNLHVPRHRDPFDDVGEIEAPAAFGALDAFAAALPEEPLPSGGLERLLAAAAAEPQRTGTGTGAGWQADPVGVASDGRSEYASGSAARARPSGVRTPVSWVPAWWRARPLAAAAVALCAVAVIAVGGAFAGIQAAKVSALQSEQRVLASWMSNPDMHLVALRTPTGGGAWQGEEYDEAGAERLGVVCILPDGRALVFLPNPAPRRANYVVIGDGPGGEVELVRGGGNLLRFGAIGIASVSVRLESASGVSNPVAWAQLR